MPEKCQKMLWVKPRTARLASIVALAPFLLLTCISTEASEDSALARAAATLRLENAIATLRNVNYDKLRKDPSLREYRAVELLFEKTDTYAYPKTYLRLLKHRNWVLRYLAADAISAHAKKMVDDDPFRPALLAMAREDPVLDVRGQAIDALNKRGDAGDCELFMALYTTEPQGTPEVKRVSGREDYRGALIRSLSRLDCPGAAALLAPKEMDIPTIMSILGSADPLTFFTKKTKEQKEA